MKKLFFVFIIIFLLTDYCFSQTGWFTQSIPTTDDYRCLYFVDSQTGWAGGFENTLLKTTNAGNNWFLQNWMGWQSLMSLYFVNSQKGWAAGGIGDQNITRITKTYDGGNNWITQYYSSSQGMVMKISFPDTNNGWAVTLGGNVFKTTNSGLNWNLSFSLSVQFTSCAFLTPNTGWVFGTIGTILKTTDAGITWDDSKCNNN